jgi:hypothetical protein
MKFNEFKSYIQIGMKYIWVKIVRYRAVLVAFLILSVGYIYRAREKRRSEEIQVRLFNKESVKIQEQETRSIMVNTNLYNKTDEEKKRFLLANFDMDNVIGNDNAPVTIIDYSSFSCDFCRDMREEIKKIIQEYVIEKKTVKYVLRPVYNKKTIPFGVFLQCMEQKKRLEFAEKFFKLDVEDVDDFDALLTGISSEYGIDGEYVMNCIRNIDIYEKIIYMQNESREVFKLRGTPILIINGEKYFGFKTYKELKKIIETKIK